MMRLYGMSFIRKGNTALRSCIRDTSCSRGWLRLFVQIIFGIIIVSSFIMIVMMSLDNRPIQNPEQRRCDVKQCRIVCNGIPFFGDHEDQIINAVSVADVSCEHIVVELNTPTFKDSILPEFWLSRIRSNVRELAIIGGNINYIASNAFLSPFSNNLDILVLEQLMLSSWETEMLVGLSNLRKLYIKDCMIGNIKMNVLKPVDDTLKFLDIKASNDWNPHNITGCSGDLALREVDFSFNNFHDILRNTSFSRLRKCKVLFLNSCKITSIAEGTFDHLQSIEVLYLNNNYLKTVPETLFEAILPHRPRIALQENYWQCNCLNEHFRNIYKTGLLIVDPLCHYPVEIRGMAFSDFEEYCDSETENSRKSDSLQSFTLYSNGICNGETLPFNKSKTLRILSPARNHKCQFHNIINVNISVTGQNVFPIFSSTKKWITPVFLTEKNPYGMLQLEALEQPGVGLIWYQSSCFPEIYCTNRIPNVLKVFNVKSEARYTFCPFNTTVGIILNSECTIYDLGSFKEKVSFEILTYLCISLGCLTFGAVCVYAIIFKNPSLLRANKRVLFVKHKSIDALIMPPTVPTRKDLVQQSEFFIERFIEKQNIYVLPNLGITSTNFIRSTSSTRSTISNDGSYISALQPTEEQLKEWRANQIESQNDNGPSSDFDSSFSSYYDHDSFPYYTFHNSQKMYDIPKEYQ